MPVFSGSVFSFRSFGFGFPFRARCPLIITKVPPPGEPDGGGAGAVRSNDRQPPPGTVTATFLIIFSNITTNSPLIIKYRHRKLLNFKYYYTFLPSLIHFPSCVIFPNQLCCITSIKKIVIGDSIQ